MALSWWTVAFLALIAYVVVPLWVYARSLQQDLAKAETNLTQMRDARVEWWGAYSATLDENVRLRQQLQQQQFEAKRLALAFDALIADWQSRAHVSERVS